MKEAIVTNQAPGAIGPYSQGIVTDQYVFTSGQLPIIASSGEMPETAAEQAQVSLQNVRAVLEGAGTAMDKVVKTTVFLQNIADFTAVNEIYAEFFTEPYPARSCVEVGALPKGALVEIEVVATR